MKKITKHPLNQVDYNFEEEYKIREKYNNNSSYRPLTQDEIIQLKKNGNRSPDWQKILVSDFFDPDLIHNNEFHGLVRIGNLEECYLDFDDFKIPVGINNSCVISSDLGDHIAIKNVSYLANYIIDNEVILSDINNLFVSSHPKFGNGSIKESEKEKDRIWIELGNENGNRAVLPFDGMTSGDAWLWYKYRGNLTFQKKLKEMTDHYFSNSLNHYGRIGKGSIIRNCRYIKDVKTGNHAIISGANKLENLTINSSAEAVTEIGEGVELINGIIGYGCQILYGVKAIRFIMQDHSILEYGARFIDSYLGSNSTIACCEVLNSLIFPGHEQHHNSSFLIASCLMGQSNIASGATIGSNHNSRSNDGEIVAGRGFWPGLNTSLKHCSRFASFCLIHNGSYPYELDIKLPFSLISNNATANELTILPAYWLMYNMYALARNSWKYTVRDKRINKSQQLAFNYLSPDTINEMFSAMTLLENWTRESSEYIKSGYSDASLYLSENDSPEIFALLTENSKRNVRILKGGKAYKTYKEWINYYAIDVISRYCKNNESSAEEIEVLFGKSERSEWENVGGQLIIKKNIKNLISKIESDEIFSWNQIHNFYTNESEKYSEDETAFAYACLKEINKSNIDWSACAKSAIKTSETIVNLTEINREKDYTSPFRNITFDSIEERDAVFGKLEENSFINQNKADHNDFTTRINDFIRKYIDHAFS